MFYIAPLPYTGKLIKPMASLTQQSTRSGVYMLLGQLGKLLINFGSLMVLARLLGADEYGLMAMIVIILGIADVFKDFGLTSAVIQAKTLSDKEKTNLWWFNTMIGFIIMCILAAGSPVISWIYQEDRLVLITLAMSVNFLLSSMSIQYFANLQREMRYGSITVNGIVSSGLSVVIAIVLAASGWGVWSLIAQYITSSLLSLIIYVLQTHWIPGRYDSSISIKPFFNFGLPLMFSNLIMYLGGSVDVFILGRFAGTEVLGLMNRASQAVRTPLNQLRSPLSSVAFSALSKRQSSDVELAKYTEQGQIVIAYPLTLFAGGMAASSSTVIAVVLGPGWEAAVPFFFFLAIAGGLNNLAMTSGWLFMAKNKNNSLMRLTLLSVLMRVVFVLVGIYTLGPVGAAVGQAIVPLIQWPLSFAWAQKSTGVSTKSLLKNSYRIFFVTVFASSITYVVAQKLVWGDFTNLIICVIVHILAILVTLVLSDVRNDFKFIFSTIKTIKK